jgi:hypothetical protein
MEEKWMGMSTNAATLVGVGTRLAPSPTDQRKYMNPDNPNALLFLKYNKRWNI